MARWAGLTPVSWNYNNFDKDAIKVQTLPTSLPVQGTVLLRTYAKCKVTQ